MSHAIQQVTIRGLVQGVGYRAWLDHQARTSKLEGWVRNRRDGSVEALFAGPPTVVAEMVALCRHGPPSARVESVTRETAGEEQLKLRYEGERFSVLPTI
jgi:acylphosphatase